MFRNSRSQIVFRTDIFRKLMLGAPVSIKINVVPSVTMIKSVYKVQARIVTDQSIGSSSPNDPIDNLGVN